jgi:hypothetical protein
MLVSNTSTSTLVTNNALDPIDYPDIKTEDVSSTKTNGNDKIYIPNNLDSSIYSSPAERDNSSKNKQVTQNSAISTPPQKRQEENDSNIFSKSLSSVKNFFLGAPPKNGDIATVNEALVILRNDTINDEKTSRALDYLAEQAASSKSFISLAYLTGKEEDEKKGRIKDFCYDLIKNIIDTGSLLKLRKRVLHFTDLSTRLNVDGTNRNLFINSLIKSIEDRINTNLHDYVKTNYQSVSTIENPTQTKKSYEEILAHIQSIKSEIRPIFRQLTNKEEEKESMDFLAETLGQIYINSSFDPKMMPEMQTLPEAVRLRFPQSMKETIDKKIQSLNMAAANSKSRDFDEAIQELKEMKANIRESY